MATIKKKYRMTCRWIGGNSGANQSSDSKFKIMLPISIDHWHANVGSDVHRIQMHSNIIASNIVG